MRKKRQAALREILVQSEETGAMPADRALLTAQQTAAALNVSVRTLAYWTARRPRGRKPRLNFVKLGKATRFVVSDVLQFIEKHKVSAA
jgi:predicted DNA-binding transcriptional regulator AlpA